MAQSCFLIAYSDLHESARLSLAKTSIQTLHATNIDLQLQAGEQSLLIGKYLGVDTSAQSGFYQAAADNVITMTDERTSMPKFVADMAGDTLSDWIGPPASYAMFVLRADALDVTYGTPEGFENLGIPYMAHITPEQLW